MIAELGYFCRRFLGPLTRVVALLFPNMQDILTKGGLYIPADAFAAFMLFISGVVGIVVGANAALLALVFTSSRVDAIAAGAIGFIMAGVVTTSLVYYYPYVLISKRRRAIEQSLPYTISFMGVLSSAGVTPKRVLRSLAQLEENGVGLGGEATVIYRDMEVFGSDLVGALKSEAKRNLSPIFTGILEGFMSTVRSGGDLAHYFEDEAKGLMRLRRSIMKEFVDILVMVSEMYMGLLVAFPLILIVMLVVMSSIGGAGIGGLSPDVIVPMVIYVMVPGAGLAILFTLDALSSD